MTKYNNWRKTPLTPRIWGRPYNIMTSRFWPIFLSRSHLVTRRHKKFRPLRYDVTKLPTPKI